MYRAPTVNNKQTWDASLMRPKFAYLSIACFISGKSDIRRFLSTGIGVPWLMFVGKVHWSVTSCQCLPWSVERTAP